MKRFAIIIIVIIDNFRSSFFPSLFFCYFHSRKRKRMNPQMYYINVAKDTLFQIRFTHSIHLTDVLETYEIIDE